jgi:hypothetical protein
MKDAVIHYEVEGFLMKDINKIYIIIINNYYLMMMKILRAKVKREYLFQFRLVYIESVHYKIFLFN